MRKYFSILLLLVFPLAAITQGVYVKPTAVIVSTNTTIVVKQHWSNNGTYIQNNGTLSFTGSDQTFGGSSCTGYDNVIIATTDSVRLLRDISVNGRLTLASGKLALQDNHLTLGGTVTGTGTLSGSVQSDLTITGSGNLGTLYFDTAFPRNSNAIRNMVINRGTTDTVILGNMLYLKGEMTPTSGVMSAEGFLTVCSDAAGTARITNAGNFIFNGEVTVERFITAKTARKWTFVSSAIAGVSIHNGWQDEIFITGAGTGGTICGAPHSNGFDATLSNSPSMYIYDQTGSVKWQSVPGTTNTNLQAGKGYRLLVRGNRNSSDACANQLNSNNPPLPAAVILSASGTLNTGDISVTIHGGNKGYTLLGNPYPCELNFRALYENNTTSISNKYWSYDPATPGTNYLTYSSGTIAGCPSNIIWGNSEGDGNGYLIASGQAFFVERPSATDTVLVFKEEYKNNQLQQGVFKSPEWKHLVRTYLKKQDNSYLDDMVIRFSDDSLVSVNENEFDALSLNSTNMISSLKGNRSFAIQTRPLQFTFDTVKIRVALSAQGNYKLSFKELSSLSLKASVQLIDNFTGSSVDVTTQPDYSFSVTADTASQGSNRFRLVFNNPVALSLQFIDVAAKHVNGKARVKWQVTSIAGVSRYEVWRSDNGQQFYRRGEVPAGASNSYEFEDSKPVGSTAYYYISAFTHDRKFNSSIVQLHARVAMHVYPNPVADVLRIGLSPNATRFTVTIQDAKGTTLIRKYGVQSNATIDMSGLPSGLYILKVTADDGSTRHQSVIKQ